MPGPHIRAEFELDDQGQPIAITTSKGHPKHFKIVLWLDEAPDDTQSVIYELDESYYDPVREVTRDVERFRESITSYGDFPVSVRIRQGRQTLIAKTQLSRALRTRYADGSPSPAIDKAIEQIERF